MKFYSSDPRLRVKEEKEELVKRVIQDTIILTSIDEFLQYKHDLIKLKDNLVQPNGIIELVKDMRTIDPENRFEYMVMKVESLKPKSLPKKVFILNNAILRMVHRIIAVYAHDAAVPDRRIAQILEDYEDGKDPFKIDKN